MAAFACYSALLLIFVLCNLHFILYLDSLTLIAKIYISEILKLYYICNLFMFYSVLSIYCWFFKGNLNALNFCLRI